MTEEIRQAIQELQRTETNLKVVDTEFEDVAILEYLTAKVRLNALIKEIKNEETNKDINKLLQKIWI